MFSCRNYEEKVGNRRIADETSDENCYDLYHRIINLIYNNVSKPPKFRFIEIGQEMASTNFFCCHCLGLAWGEGNFYDSIFH